MLSGAHHRKMIEFLQQGEGAGDEAVTEELPIVLAMEYPLGFDLFIETVDASGLSQGRVVDDCLNAAPRSLKAAHDIDNRSISTVLDYEELCDRPFQSGQ